MIWTLRRPNSSDIVSMFNDALKLKRDMEMNLREIDGEPKILVESLVEMADNYLRTAIILAKREGVQADWLQCLR